MKLFSIREFITIIVIPIAISVFIHFLGQTKHELTVLLQSKESLVNELGDQFDLKVTFKEQDVQDPKYLKIIIENTGSEPIEKDDFQKPLQISFGDESEVLAAAVSSTTPADIPAEFSVLNNKLVLTPLLLNSTDKVEVSVFVSGPSTQMLPSARISNINKIRILLEETHKMDHVTVALYLLAMFSVSTFYFLLMNREVEKALDLNWFNFNIMHFGLVIAFIALMVKLEAQTPEYHVHISLGVIVLSLVLFFAKRSRELKDSLPESAS
ncbi:hypothetical protein [Vibrio nigripulchritudo]|uniref:hypothetical protein n=1 Tax=Vibrio nigripulchritudo TaxID=28173 RepID=UPI0005FA3D79|nr:hypothetical protein [Vibrio nigripulchritudo]KJY78970.1 hypothetical protein TW74_09740 [Vibrio nigripulchritudo]